MDNSTTHDSSSLSPRAGVSTAELLLQDGSRFPGERFGSPCSRAGEVVFNTGMVGYPEAMTDPSYRGQVLVSTYPLTGNYGVPAKGRYEFCANGAVSSVPRESDRIQVSGLIVSSRSRHYSHPTALDSLDSWMRHHDIPGMSGVDTRTLTKKLRTHGTMLGKIVVADNDVDWSDPNTRNVVAEVSIREPRAYSRLGEKSVILVDFG